MRKYFTVVILAEDETTARGLVPGEKIGPNTIVGCALGDALSLNEKLRELIPDEKHAEVSAAEMADLKPFIRDQQPELLAVPGA